MSCYQYLVAGADWSCSHGRQIVFFGIFGVCYFELYFMYTDGRICCMGVFLFRIYCDFLDCFRLSLKKYITKAYFCVFTLICVVRFNKNLFKSLKKLELLVGDKETYFPFRVTKPFTTVPLTELLYRYGCNYRYSSSQFNIPVATQWKNYACSWRYLLVN